MLLSVDHVEISQNCSWNMKKIIYLRNIEVSADEKIISNDSYI